MNRVEEAKRILSDNKNDNLTIGEIVEILSISGSTSRSQFSRAKQKLIQEIERI